LQAAIDYDPETGRMLDKKTGIEMRPGTKGRVQIGRLRPTGARLAWALGTGSADFRNVYALNGDERDLRLANLRVREEERYDEYGKVSRFIHYKYGLLKRYGLTRADYDRMYAAQNGLCAMCAEPERRRQRGTERPALLGVDHDHRAQAVRELLCDRCNRLLGICDDDESLLLRGVEYLRRHRKLRLNIVAKEA
jgi:hypothetical protein